MGVNDITYEEKIQQAVADVDQPQQNLDPENIVLSTGVVLRYRKFSRMIMQGIIDKFPYPDPPKVYIKDKDRYETNPLDKDYKEAVARIDEQRSLAFIDAIIAFGTELVSAPDDLPAIDDDEWIDELELVGIKVLRDKKKSRYLAWVKYVAMVDTETDLAKVMGIFTRVEGATEETVAQAIDNFRRVQERTTDTGDQT